MRLPVPRQSTDEAFVRIAGATTIVSAAKGLSAKEAIVSPSVIDHRQRAAGYGTLFSMTASTSARPGRNQPCHCGSGRKYKHCCLAKDAAQATAARAKAAAKAAAQPPEAATSVPRRAPKPETHQPWKATTSRGFVPRTRTPRKVGG